MFGFCENLKVCDLPDMVREIGEMAFYLCSAYRVEHLPYHLEKIGKEAFRQSLFGRVAYFTPSGRELGSLSCCGIHYAQFIYSQSVVPPVCLGGEQTPFGNITKPEALWRNKTLFVPEGTLSAYQAAPGWKEFEIIKEIPDSEFPTSDIKFVSSDIVDSPRYDLNGRKLSEPVPGQIYIERGHKTIAR